ncbi:MAG TPA: SHOCT domain-containing protein [Candidatus Limnocylindrales bacterium]
MRRVVILRLLALLAIVVVVMGVAGVVAYHFGVTSGSNTPMMRDVPFRGHEVTGMWNSDWPGLGLLGVLALIIGGVLFIWLLAALLSPDRGKSGTGVPVGGQAASAAVIPPGTPPAGPAAGDVERLRELSELHTAGHLTDEEFTAAKRKLLGM